MRKIGLIFHGPEVIDEGEAREAIELFKKGDFELEAALGGITGKTAVIDAEMQRIIDISKNKKPSQVIEDFFSRNINFIVLVNHAKNEKSGFFLGEHILENFIENKSKDEKENAFKNLSFIQIEYSSKTIFRWLVREQDEDIYKKIAETFGFKEKKGEFAKPTIYKKDNLVYREIKGVLPNEKILVNGVVIGLSSEKSVTLVAKEGRIIKIIGGTLISHNLCKLAPLKLEEAIIKTASVFRRTKPKKVKIEEGIRKEGGKSVACIFFDVENLFSRIEEGNGDVAVAVTMGDDTTSIAGDILKRFGIRLIGITDGDADGLIQGIESDNLEEYNKFLPKESIVIRLNSERDDIAGKRIKEEIFGGREEMEIEFAELKRRIKELVKEEIIGVVERGKI